MKKLISILICMILAVAFVSAAETGLLSVGSKSVETSRVSEMKAVSKAENKAVEVKETCKVAESKSNEKVSDNREYKRAKGHSEAIKNSVQSRPRIDDYTTKYWPVTTKVASIRQSYHNMYLSIVNKNNNPDKMLGARNMLTISYTDLSTGKGYLLYVYNFEQRTWEAYDQSNDYAERGCNTQTCTYYTKLLLPGGSRQTSSYTAQIPEAMRENSQLTYQVCSIISNKEIVPYETPEGDYDYHCAYFRVNA